MSLRLVLDVAGSSGDPDPDLVGRPRQGTIDGEQVAHSHELVRYETEFTQVLTYGLIDLRCLDRGIELLQK